MKNLSAQKIAISGLVMMLPLLLLFNCTKDLGSLPPPPPPPKADDCDTVTYSVHIQKILAAKCINCHNDNTKSDGVALNTYERVKEVADNGRLRGVILGESGYPLMPYGSQGLPKAEKDLIVCWINNGKKQ